MSRVTCAISGLHFSTEHFTGLSIPHTAGYFHPIFACTYKQLHHLYSQHCKGELAPKDSYLLFLAFLHSTEQVSWKAPASIDPNSPACSRLIENNLSQLLEVIAKTAVIKHPSFSQPSFLVTYDNSNLESVPNWIRAWKKNIQHFHTGRADLKALETLQKVENRLTYLILSGEPTERFTHVIADWACKAAEFPPEVEEKWKLTIRSCFNITKMFNTPLPLLKEIKDYCECNIEVGSVHFHTLSTVLGEGIARHTDYLGGSTLALGYTLLPAPTKRSSEAELKNSAELATIAAKAPEKYPVRTDYQNAVSFLRAKLAYRTAITIRKQEAQNQEKEIEENESNN